MHGSIFTSNLLTADGEAHYYGPIFKSHEADILLQHLLTEIPWRHDLIKMFGKEIVTARQIAWFGDHQFDYAYSGHSHRALAWTPLLLEIKARAEALANACYNSCLLNLYHDGQQGMGWHQDNEKCLGLQPNIASISFGAERRFHLRHKVTKERISLTLEHGSLLVMKGSTQSHWQHQLPKSTKITKSRVNLTFRHFCHSSQ